MQINKQSSINSVLKNTAHEGFCGINPALYIKEKEINLGFQTVLCILYALKQNLGEKD